MTSFKKRLKVKYLRTEKFLYETEKGNKIGRIILAIFASVAFMAIIYPLHIFSNKEILGLGIGLANFVLFDFLVGLASDIINSILLLLSLVYSAIYPLVSLIVFLSQLIFMFVLIFS
jgi:hypothetical protein